jgi:hypothetical protein
VRCRLNEEFNKKQKGDGIGFKTTESGKLMRIPRNKEAQHFQIMGDTGVGKFNSSCKSCARFGSAASPPSSTIPLANAFSGSTTRNAATSF